MASSVDTDQTASKGAVHVSQDLHSFAQPLRLNMIVCLEILYLPSVCGQADLSKQCIP